MTKRYEKPIIQIGEDYSEGVYLASGTGRVQATIKKIPTNSWDPYEIDLAVNNEKGDDPLKFTITFSQKVTNAWGVNGNINGINTNKLSFEVWTSDTVYETTLNVVSDSGLYVVSCE